MRSLMMGLIAVTLLPCVSARAQIEKQRECAHIVESNIAATKKQKPEIFKTINGYLFEYNSRLDACVIVMQYKVVVDGKNEIQVLAMNAVTRQAMEGYKNIFLIPANDTQGVIDSVNFLFDKYSH